MGRNNEKSATFAAVIWLTFLLLLAYETYKQVDTEINKININLKSFEDVINGNS